MWDIIYIFCCFFKSDERFVEEEGGLLKKQHSYTSHFDRGILDLLSPGSGSYCACIETDTVIDEVQWTRNSLEMKSSKTAETQNSPSFPYCARFVDVVFLDCTFRCWDTNTVSEYCCTVNTLNLALLGDTNTFRFKILRDYPLNLYRDIQL